MHKIVKILLGVLIGTLLTAALLMVIPSVREKVLWHLDETRVRIRYALFPPEQAIFVPNAEAAAQPSELTAVPTATPSLTATITPTHEISPTPTLTATPLPAAIKIEGIPYIDQHGLWNYCAPSTLAMALSYWGWEGTRTDVGQIVKPFDKDKNVMPYELADYAETEAGLKTALRSGGTLDLLKLLVANGFPVVIEKGLDTRDQSGKISWMGHYVVVSGYDEAAQQFITQDAYFSADYLVNYADLNRAWRAFNYTFIVIFKPEEEARVLTLLGDYADPAAANQIAAEKASEEIFELTGRDQFFAYFNRGTSLANLQDYFGAASTFDQAFNLLPGIKDTERPWRMMWYQTAPYFAYYYSGRYWDVVNLADTTIDAADQPYIEESFVWRARARIALGDTQGAAEDVRTSLEYHPGFGPSLELAQFLGIQP